MSPRFHREADFHPRAEDLPGFLARHVALAQMDAVGSRQPRDLDRVVDEERHAGGGQRRFQRPRQLQDLRKIRLFFAQLHHRHAARDGFEHQCAEIPPAGVIAPYDQTERGVEFHLWAILIRAERSPAVRLQRASRKWTCRVPGPCAFCAASSAATFMIAMPSMAAARGEAATAAKAPSTAAGDVESGLAVGDEINRSAGDDDGTR